MKSLLPSVLALGLLGCGGAPGAAPATPGPLGPPLSYVVPTCPVRYEVETVERFQAVDSARPGGTNGIDTFVALDGQPTAKGWELTPSVTVFVRQGKYRPFARPDTSYAPIELASAGARLTETDGSTMLYRRAGSQIGLALLFPDLPRASAEGSTADWRIVLPDDRDVLATEAARGKHEGLKDLLAKNPGAPAGEAQRPLEATVRLARWTTEGGVRAAVLEMNATYAVDAPLLEGGGTGMPDVRMAGSSVLKGQYVVLETGRLLRASVEMTGTTDMTWKRPTEPAAAQPETMHQTRTMKMEGHLVRACDGPTDRPMAATLSPEDAAIDACGALVLAVLEKKRDAFFARVSSELRKGQKDDDVWSTLEGYVKTRGERAFLPPALIDDRGVKSGGDGSTVIVTVNGITPSRTEKNTMTPVEVAVTLVREGPSWLASRIVAKSVMNDEGLLEVAPTRLYLAK